MASLISAEHLHPMSQGKSFKSQRHIYVAATETCFLITLLCLLTPSARNQIETPVPKHEHEEIPVDIIIIK